MVRALFASAGGDCASGAVAASTSVASMTVSVIGRREIRVILCSIFPVCFFHCAGVPPPGAVVVPFSEARYRNLLSAFEGRLVRADADKRPVDRRFRVRHRRLVAHACHQEIVNEVGMRSTMAASLKK